MLAADQTLERNPCVVLPTRVMRGTHTRILVFGTSPYMPLQAHGSFLACWTFGATTPPRTFPKNVSTNGFPWLSLRFMANLSPSSLGNPWFPNRKLRRPQNPDFQVPERLLANITWQAVLFVGGSWAQLWRMVSNMFEQERERCIYIYICIYAYLRMHVFIYIYCFYIMCHGYDSFVIYIYMYILVQWLRDY